MSDLPEKFVADGLRMAKEATLFGKPMTELSPTELLAACAQGWAAYRDAQREQMGRSNKLFRCHQ